MNNRTDILGTILKKVERAQGRLLRLSFPVATAAGAVTEVYSDFMGRTAAWAGKDGAGHGLAVSALADDELEAIARAL